ncbi:MAG: hypothetical protein NT051_04070 [Candidatus Micrarchaeota archaeon]|nr:hypothetical protein [Candidatus Micrarchaeota archaeon]
MWKNRQLGNSRDGRIFQHYNEETSYFQKKAKWMVDNAGVIVCAQPMQNRLTDSPESRHDEKIASLYRAISAYEQQAGKQDTCLFILRSSLEFNQLKQELDSTKNPRITYYIRLEAGELGKKEGDLDRLDAFLRRHREFVMIGMRSLIDDVRDLIGQQMRQVGAITKPIKDDDAFIYPPLPKKKQE